MSDQSYLLAKLAAGAACLLLALIPAFIGKRKGYRFETYYALGAASFPLALILVLIVRPREDRDLDTGISSFRPGQTAVYLTLACAALSTLALLYTLIARSGLIRAFSTGAGATILYMFLVSKLPATAALWVLGGGLLGALKARTDRRALVAAMVSIAIFAAITITYSMNNAFSAYSSETDAYYMMPLVIGIYMLAIAFALFGANRTVVIAASIAGMVCAVCYAMFFITQIAQTLNGRVLYNMLTNGTLFWMFGVISALAAVLGGVSKRSAAQYEAAAAASGRMESDRFAAIPAAAPQAAPIAAAQPATVAETPALPAMVVFAAESENAASMAMFGNTQRYYSPEYCIDRVRANFHLPADARIDYVARADWDGPVPALAGDQFQIDVPLVQRLERAYLTGRLGLTEQEAADAVTNAQAMQAPRLGLLWLCVPVPSPNA